MEHLMGEPIGPVELSRRLHMTSASATVLVDRLEEAGHVVREPDPHDGRRRVVRPTAAGRQRGLRPDRPDGGRPRRRRGRPHEKDRAAVVTYLSACSRFSRSTRKCHDLGLRRLIADETCAARVA